MKPDASVGFTREEYDRICRRAEERGIKILTKYRKGLKTIRCGEIVLCEWDEDGNVIQKEAEDES